MYNKTFYSVLPHTVKTPTFSNVILPFLNHSATIQDSPLVTYPEFYCNTVQHKLSFATIKNIYNYKGGYNLFMYESIFFCLVFFPIKLVYSQYKTTLSYQVTFRYFVIMHVVRVNKIIIH